MDLINPRIHQELHKARDWQSYWAQAAKRVHWTKPWQSVFESDPPTFRWFSGATTNLGANAVDLWAQRSPGHAALIALTENGDVRTYTYAQMAAEVHRLAAGFVALGIQPGDRVAIYMPTGPEAIFSMLALSRIGAIHMVVFAGFGSAALAQRIQLAQATVLIASDVSHRRGKVIPLSSIVAEALHDPHSPVRTVIWQQRTDHALPPVPVRTVLWNDLRQEAPSHTSEAIQLESNTPAFILATSGTTARPKLVVHMHGPYQVGILHASQILYGLSHQDVWWSTSDIGWIVGHSFIVYAPLLVGATTISYEGALDFPSPEHFYRIIADHKVSAILTAPTAVRLLMQYGTDVARKHDLSSVTRVFSAGEPLNAPAWEWFQHDVFNNQIPVIDHWWQTETGGPVIGNPYSLGLLPIKPGSAGIPLPGYGVEIRQPDGTRAAPKETGSVVITHPFPGLTQELWNDAERYRTSYWEQLPGVYLTGDAANIDEDGYVWFSGRADEILKIAGHRIGTSEVETAILRHPAVAEVGVTGAPDPLRGDVIAAFVVLRPGLESSPQLADEIRQTVRRELGAVAVIGAIEFVKILPKTRSGKIMRRVLRSVVRDENPGDVSTIEDPTAVAALTEVWHQGHSPLDPNSSS
ncbi:MAG: acetate--CoA ligase [Sulfobacillus thermotolerans]|nr:acetate--CoA ligase [Sulfobacillus thermotolerans]